MDAFGTPSQTHHAQGSVQITHCGIPTACNSMHYSESLGSVTSKSLFPPTSTDPHSFKCWLQQGPPLQQKDSRWPRQVYAVLLDLLGVPLSEDEFSSPAFLLFLFVLIQYVHLICLATTLPALLPFSTFCFPISTCSHLYRETACLPSYSEATCDRSAVTNFKKHFLYPQRLST